MLIRVPREDKVLFVVFMLGGITFSGWYSGNQLRAGGLSFLKMVSLCDLCSFVTASKSDGAKFFTAPLLYG